MHVAVIIPALDEEGAIAAVVADIGAAVRACGHDCTVIVADNGSRDRTVERAENAGAVVVVEERRGYGAACLKAIAHLPPAADVVLFADGDGADDPRDVAALLLPFARGRADLVIGSRALGERLGLVEDDALTRAQRFGNRLATVLLRLVLKHSASDLGPFRAISRDALARLDMDDPAFGWTMQMQARAARMRLRVVEVPVRYRRRRSGRSKVSGDVKASAQAGAVILKTLAVEAVRRPPRALPR